MRQVPTQATDDIWPRHTVWLDGVEQRFVTEAGPGYLVRGKCLPEGEAVPDGFGLAGRGRALFDRRAADFVLERVEGFVEIEAK
jgi:hypothetical protein